MLVPASSLAQFFLSGRRWSSSSCICHSVEVICSFLPLYVLAMSCAGASCFVCTVLSATCDGHPVVGFAVLVLHDGLHMMRFLSGLVTSPCAMELLSLRIVCVVSDKWPYSSLSTAPVAESVNLNMYSFLTTVCVLVSVWVQSEVDFATSGAVSIFLG